jgi:hypothetical protein
MTVPIVNTDILKPTIYLAVSGCNQKLPTLLILLLGTWLTAYAKQSKLPPCPKPDYSKNVHLGIGGRTEKWHNCYGRYVAGVH